MHVTNKRLRPFRRKWLETISASANGSHFLALAQQCSCNDISGIAGCARDYVHHDPRI
jgi:hypothetical protein